MLCWRVALTELKNTYCWIDSSICLCCVPWFNKQIKYKLEYTIPGVLCILRMLYHGR